MKQLPIENYDKYIEIQRETTARKMAKDPDRCWTESKCIDLICDEILEYCKPQFGICHGVRNGLELDYFNNKLKCSIIGTDVADLGRPDVLIMDFHVVLDKWINTADFIYSNALDHSYNPHYALSQWGKCLNKNGCLFLEWSKTHNMINEATGDLFGATLEEYLEMVKSGFNIVKTFKSRSYSTVIMLKPKR